VPARRCGVMIVEGFVILGTITALVLMRQQGGRLA
jgi:hypothetical protein